MDLDTGVGGIVVSVSTLLGLGGSFVPDFIALSLVLGLGGSLVGLVIPELSSLRLGLGVLLVDFLVPDFILLSPLLGRGGFVTSGFFWTDVEAVV